MDFKKQFCQPITILRQEPRCQFCWVQHLSNDTSIRIPRSEVEFTFARSSGPGGQNVNKVNSKATLRWNLLASPSVSDELRQRLLRLYARRITEQGDLLITSQRYRDQARNIEDCLHKLQEMVASAARVPKRRRPTRPTKKSAEERLKRKQVQARKKQTRRKVDLE